eukprot:gene4591-4921_t
MEEQSTQSSSNSSEVEVQINASTVDPRVPINPIAKVLHSRNVSLNIKWSSVCSTFESLYTRSYTASKKAHFDSLPEDWSADDKVVDGARSRWCLPLILDAILTILENDRFDLSHRRSFNQGRVLRDCILREVQEHYPSIYSELVKQAEKKPKKLLFTPTYRAQNRYQQNTLNDHGDSESSDLVSLDLPESSSARSISGGTRSDISMNHSLSPQEILQEYGKASSVQVVGSFKGWKTIKELRAVLIAEDPASKSKKKYISIVNALLNHPLISFYHEDVIQLLKIVAFKAIFVFPFIGHSVFALESSLADINSGKSLKNQTEEIAEKQVEATVKVDAPLQPTLPQSGTSKLDEANLSVVTPPTLKRKIEEVTSSKKIEGSSNDLKKRKINLLEYLDYEKLSKLDYAEVLEVLNCAQKSSDSELSSPSNTLLTPAPIINNDLTALQSIYYWFEKHSQLPIVEPTGLPSQFNLAPTLPLPTSTSNNFNENNLALSSSQANYMMQCTILESMIQQLSALNNSHITNIASHADIPLNQSILQSMASDPSIQQDSINLLRFISENGSNVSQLSSNSNLQTQQQKQFSFNPTYNSLHNFY